MVDDEFEWDDAKAAANLARHRVSFELAREVFADPFALDWRDERADYGEERYASIGIVQDRRLVRRLHDAGGAHSHHFGTRSYTP